jgi:hypothetical protein
VTFDLVQEAEAVRAAGDAEGGKALDPQPAKGREHVWARSVQASRECQVIAESPAQALIESGLSEMARRAVPGACSRVGRIDASSTIGSHTR